MNKKRKLFIFWELPQLLVAVAFYFILMKKITCSCKYKDTLIFFVNGFPGGISLSFIIFLNSKYIKNLDMIRHEYGHSRQSIILGWFYLAIVGIPSLTRAIIWNTKKLKKDDYYKKFPENWADRLGGRGI